MAFGVVPSCFRWARVIAKPAYQAVRCSSSAIHPGTLAQVTTVEAPHCGHIKILTLNRPKAKNAISRELLAQVSQQIADLDTRPSQTRVLIIASAVERVFCAGADLKERKTFTMDDTRKFLTDLRSTFSRLANLPIPTISAINGYALGGGMELALCTTFRVAASTAVLALPETQLGIIPGAGGTFRLPAILGPQLARNMILRGQRLSAAEAKAVGLVDAVREVSSTAQAQEEVIHEAVKFAIEICSGAPIAVNQALAALNGWQLGDKSENDAYENILPTQDRVRALEAFEAKKKPHFEGS